MSKLEEMYLQFKYSKKKIAKAIKIVSEGTEYRTKYNEAKKLLVEVAQLYIASDFEFKNIDSWTECPTCKHSFKWTLNETQDYKCGEGAGMFGLAAHCECADHKEQYLKFKNWIELQEKLVGEKI